MTKETLNLVLSGVGGLLVGGSVGFVVTRHILKTKYEAIAQEEINDVKEFYRNRDKDVVEESSDVPDFSKEEDEQLEADIAQLDAIVASRGYDEQEIEVSTGPYMGGMSVEERTPIHEAEFLEFVEKRNTNEPYVISIDEFMDEHEDYDKHTLTYFEADETLIDSNEKIIPEVSATVGIDPLTMFGRFSKDKNIVYVRNERLEMDYEVCLDTRSYTEAIAGFRSPKVNMKMREVD